MKFLLAFASLGATLLLAVAEGPSGGVPSARDETTDPSSPPSAAAPAESGVPKAAEGDSKSADKSNEEKPDHNVHDFSHLTGRDEDTCGACHLPHLELPAGEEPPVGAEDGGPFVIRRQRRVESAPRYTPGPTSMVCLSCHNGTVAASTVGAAHSMIRDSGDRVAWRFENRDHPVGVVYPLRRDGYRPRSAVEAGGKVTLPDGRVECISCHDHHEEEGNPHLLVMSNKRSALCLTCHEK